LRLASAPVAGMLGAPGPHPLDIRRAAEVLPIGRLAQPAALTGCLARALTVRPATVALVVRVAHIRMEQFTAVQTLASSSLFHLGNPPSYTKHRRQPRSSPPQRGAEEDAKQDPKTEEEDEKMGGERTRRRNFCACSLRPDDYRFSSALTIVARKPGQYHFIKAHVPDYAGNIRLSTPMCVDKRPVAEKTCKVA